MGLVSAIIPSRNEIFLTKTIRDILVKAAGQIEVIAVIDENPPEEWVDDARVTYLRQPTPRGMRAAINWAVSVAKGDYLLKCDAHCMFAEGFDEALKADCEPNWIVIPRRHSLDAENWAIEQNRKSGRDYHYLCYPDPAKGHDQGMHGVEWPQRSRERRDDPRYEIDDTPSFQGSCWFMHKSWFTDFLKGMSEVGYGTFSQEPQEIGMKTWLGGGAVKVNKKTHYCHLHKGKRYGRMYHQDKGEIVSAHNWSAHHWVHNQEPNMIRSFAWFVEEKFAGMPTWPDNWREVLGYKE